MRSGQVLSVILVLFLVQISVAKSKYALNPISAQDIGSFVTEPSGATFSELTNSLWTICDKPSCNYIYEMSIMGEPIRKWSFQKGTHDDIEAVAVDDPNKLIYIAEEGFMRITAFDLPQIHNTSSYTLNGSDYRLKQIREISVDIDDIRDKYYTSDPTDRPGLEGMTVNTKNGTIIVANEKEPVVLVHINATTGEIFNLVYPTYTRDISGLNYDPVLDLLWVLGDKDQSVYVTDLTGKTVIDYWDLPMDNPEGIAIDNNQDPAKLYIVTDPSSPHGKQYVPALFIFNKPEVGTGREFGKNVPPAEDCDGCSSLYAEIEAISSFISTDEEYSQPGVYFGAGILAVSFASLCVLIVGVLLVVCVSVTVVRRFRAEQDQFHLLDEEMGVDF